MKNLEVEIRGPLTKQKFIQMKQYLSQKAKFIKNYKRLSLMYFSKKIPKNVNQIKNEKIDLRIRITDGHPELMLKYGNWSGSDIREESAINIQKNQLRIAIKVLKYLGWHIVVAYGTVSYIYFYKNIEFKLVEIKDYGFFYEAEILTNKMNTEKAMKNIQHVINTMGLKEFKTGEFEKQCNDINNQPKFQFNFMREKDFIRLKKQFKKFLK